MGVIFCRVNSPEWRLWWLYVCLCLRVGRIVYYLKDDNRGLILSKSRTPYVGMILAKRATGFHMRSFMTVYLVILCYLGSSWKHFGMFFFFCRFATALILLFY